MVRKIPNSKPRPQTRVEGVLFCPFTPNSALKKELMKIEEFINGQSKVGKIRIVERAGPKLGQILTNKTPWKKEWCGREGPPLSNKTRDLQDPKPNLQDHLLRMPSNRQENCIPWRKCKKFLG